MSTVAETAPADLGSACRDLQQLLAQAVARHREESTYPVAQQQPVPPMPPIADVRGKVALGAVVYENGGLTLHIHFEAPHAEPTKLLAARFAEAQAAWKKSSSEFGAFDAALAAVAASESELSAAAAEATAAKERWHAALETGADHSEAEACYATARGKAGVIEERLTVQRDILARRRDAAVAAWNVEFAEVMRREEQRLESDIRSIRQTIARRLDGAAYDHLREALAAVVPLKLRVGMQNLVTPI